MQYSINRTIEESLKRDFFKGKIIILVGPRQVGKTTLINHILENYSSIITFSGDDRKDRNTLAKNSFAFLDNLIGEKKVIFIDEAQKIEEIGNTLKLLVDNYGEEKQIIATGSSSLNLLSNTSEPLTGRKYVYELYPLSVGEIYSQRHPLDIDKELESLLIYGTYPDIYKGSLKLKENHLTEIIRSYLYKDILELENVKNSSSLDTLLSALALQIGSEVSLSELSNLLNLNLRTVERYIDLLEKNYVIFRLPPYYTNERKVLSKQNKIYFYDLGIRNALINNFNPLSKRNDRGALWENFLIIERMKLNAYTNRYVSKFFWRTYDGAEIDYIEKYADSLDGFEFKWSKVKNAPKSWLEYTNAKYELINMDNFKKFLKISK
ncbi:MAG TPA: ATP-binding protein [Candidatus Dojkabacteria bacterium]|nr:ATP-binding protein [Candidatus Dojkabacteria bacterium]